MYARSLANRVMCTFPAIHMYGIHTSIFAWRLRYNKPVRVEQMRRVGHTEMSVLEGYLR
jgi:hypothetical protein